MKMELNQHSATGMRTEMKLKDRKRLMAKSLLAFGVSSRYKTIMRRGRVVTDKAGNFKETVPISAQEIEDSMDYILEERKNNQQRMMEEMNVVREKDDGQGSIGSQQDGGSEKNGEGSDASTDGSKA